LFYRLLKLLIRATGFLFCKQIRIINQDHFNQKGPLLIVANHPNSFLDAILIGAQCKYPIHFFARGDAFQQKKYRIILRLFNMMPIYRLSEGKENLYLNEFSFKESNQILASGGIVLIFIEGICVNSHELQPFKKGTARIALMAETFEPLYVLPVAITYNSFTKFGKTVIIEAAKPIPINRLFPYVKEASNYVNFNSTIKPIIQQMIHWPIIEKENSSKYLNIVANAGKVLHYPFYKLISKFVRAKTKGTVFYDSVLFAVLMIIYPFYLVAIASLIFYLSNSFLLVIVVVASHLFLAKAATLYQKKQTTL